MANKSLRHYKYIYPFSLQPHFYTSNVGTIRPEQIVIFE